MHGIHYYLPSLYYNKTTPQTILCNVDAFSVLQIHYIQVMHLPVMASGAAACLALPPLQQVPPVETGSWLLTCSVAERVREIK